MEWSDFDFWKFLAGLGIFMFGMFLLEEAIKQLSGKAFKKFIKKSTKGKIRSIFTGFFSTAILQSSSAVSLMTLTFVGAGMISMYNGIGVIMGANLGTTATSWLVATVGFKINIEGLFLPLLAIGGLGLMFMHNSSKYAGISKIFVGLGFLFMGLDYMKMSVEALTDSFEISSLTHYGLWFYVIIAIVLTSVMQSSSATIAIILTALNSGILNFDEGAAMIIGANIGTTTTVMLGAIGGIQLKKQVALSHLIFNLFTGIVALLALPLLVRIVYLFFEPGTGEVLAVTLFHTLFNLLGILLFFPFIGILVRWLQKVLPEKQHKTTKYINVVSFDLPEAAEVAVRNETIHAFYKTMRLISLFLKMEEKEEEEEENSFNIRKEFFSTHKKENFVSVYEDLQNLNKEILVFSSQIPVDELEESQKYRSSNIKYIVMVLSQVSKTLAGIVQEMEEVDNSSNKKVQQILNHIKSKIKEDISILLGMLDKEEFPESTELYMDKVNADYKIVVDKITHAIEEKKIEEKHISTLFMINGFLTHSTRQLFRAVEKFH